MQHFYSRHFSRTLSVNFVFLMLCFAPCIFSLQAQDGSSTMTLKDIVDKALSQNTNIMIADFMGITGATGHYRSGWALYFLGLENYPDYRTGGRLQNYLPIEGNTPQQFQNICWIVKSAIDQLEAFYKELPPQKFSRAGRCAMLMALSETPLMKLKDSVAMGMLCERFQELFEKTQLTHDATENGMAGIVSLDLAKQID